MKAPGSPGAGLGPVGTGLINTVMEVMKKVKAFQLITVAAADPAVGEIVRILDRVRNTLMIVLTGLAIVALTYAGVRYLLAVGDPGGVERAKHAAKSALVGLGLALLAPVVVAIVKQILGA